MIGRWDRARRVRALPGCVSPKGRARRAEKEAPVAAVTEGKLGCAKQAPIPIELPGGGQTGSRRLPGPRREPTPEFLGAHASCVAWTPRTGTKPDQTRIPGSARILRGLDASNRDETGTKHGFLGAHASCVAWTDQRGRNQNRTGRLRMDTD